MIHLDRMTSAQCPSGYRLDKLRAGELRPSASVAALHDHLRTCAPCAERLAEMNRFGARFRAAPPASLIGRERARLAIVKSGQDEVPRGRAASARRRRSVRWKRRSAAGLVLAAAAAGLILISENRKDHAPASHVERVLDEGTRIKGSRAGVIFYVERDGLVRAGGPNEVVHPGDILQFVYTAETAGYLAILSRDGAGAGSVYFAEAGRAAAIEPGAGVSLPRSVKLDETLGPETLYVLACDHPEPVDPLRRSLAAGGAIVSPAGCAVTALHIDKRLP